MTPAQSELVASNGKRAEPAAISAQIPSRGASIVVGKLILSPKLSEHASPIAADSARYEPLDSSRSSLRAILAKMNNGAGFAGAATTPMSSAADDGTPREDAERLPLCERAETGLRALEALRESLTGARGGKPLLPRPSTQHSRFGPQGTGLEQAHEPRARQPVGAIGAPSASCSGSPSLGSRASSMRSVFGGGSLWWTDELEFVYDLLRSEELHHMLAVADASWSTNEDMREYEDMRAMFSAMFSAEALPSSESFSTQAGDGDAAERLRAPNKAPASSDSATGGLGRTVSRRHGGSTSGATGLPVARRTARRSMADDDTDTMPILLAQISSKDDARLSRWRDQIASGDEDISVHELARVVTNPLSFVAMAIFSRHKLNETFGIGFTRMSSFCKALNAGYRDSNAFHNRLHAADVALATHLFILHSGIIEQRALEPFHILAMVFGALVHDFRHPGVTNTFLVNSGDPLALTYNDKSVLENYHVSEAFKLMQQAQYNIFHALDPKQQRELRALVVRMVLATDMAEHFGQVTELVSSAPTLSEQAEAAATTLDGGKPTSAGSKGPPPIATDRLLSILMHTADISHPFRQLDSHVDFSIRIRDEFFAQGDLERKRSMEVAPMFDRELYEGEAKFAQQQIGFIQAIVRPLLEAVCAHFPALRPRLVPRLERTISYWHQVLGSPQPPAERRRSVFKA